MATDTYYPINGRITLYSYLHHSKPVRVIATALTDLTDDTVRLSNWQIKGVTVTLTVEQNGGSNYQVTFPCETKETTLPSPGRSFRWSEFLGCWVHKKSGVRVINA